MALSALLRPDAVLLALSLVGAFLTWNVYRPLRPTIAVGTIAFFLGWLTGELAIPQIVAQALVTLFLVEQGALASELGWLGLVVSVLSWVALFRFHLRGHTVGSHTQDVVRPLLGAGESETARAVRLGIRQLLWPFAMRVHGVRRVRNVPVAEVPGRTLRADVFHREDVRAGAPVLVYVHGGGWTIGFKEYQGLPLLYRMAAEGWVCVSVSYRLSPMATYPDHAADVMRGIAWAKKHAAEYGGDARFVAIAGNSAGGHLAAVAALGWDEPLLKPGFEDDDVRVQAAVCLYGVYDPTNRGAHWPGLGIRPAFERAIIKKKIEEAPDVWRVATPLDLVRDDAPPFFLVHGNRDSLVPVKESRTFQEVLRARSSNTVLYAEIPGAQHAFDIFHTVRGRHVIEAIVQFLRVEHGRAEGTRPTNGGGAHDGVAA